MGRFIGSSLNRGSQGGGGLGPTEPYDRNVGFRTDSLNNVKKIELGDFKYTDVQYNAVGLITGYNETFGGSTKGWVLTYDSQNLIDEVTERTTIHAPAPDATVTSSAYNIDEGSGTPLTITVNTANFDSGTLYWGLSGISTDTMTADFTSDTGNVTISSSTGSFALTPLADNLTEGNETFKVVMYQDSARTIEVGNSPAITINDTSIGTTIGTQSNPAVNAKEIYDSTSTNNRTNGYYWIKGNGTAGNARLFYCILDSQWGSGGGWMVISNHDAAKYANTSGSNHQPRPTATSGFTGADGNQSNHNPTESEMIPDISFSCNMTDIPYTKVMHMAYDNSGMSSISNNNWLGNPKIYWCSSFSSPQTMPTSNAWSQQFNNAGLSLSWGGSDQSNLRHCYSSSDFNCEGWGVFNASGQSTPYRNGSNNSAQYDPCYCATWAYATSGASETTSWHDTGNYGYDDWQDGSGQGDGWYVGNTGSKQDARDKPSFLLVQ
tara:strand:- start:1061 stop:2536 length:1476 start_codon:yes stop_codon:yes gene_type:complete